MSKHKTKKKQTMKRKLIQSLFLIFLFIIACNPAVNTDLEKWQEQAENTTIIRDNWGIPHVYGKTDADAVFGLIYAQ